MQHELQLFLHFSLALFRKKQYLCPRNGQSVSCVLSCLPLHSAGQTVYILIKAFIDALRLTIRRLRNFSRFKVKIKVSNRCLPIWYLPYRIGVCRCVMSPYLRRLLVVYLTLKAMRRPPYANKQLGGLRFLYIYLPCKQYQQINIVY